MPDLDPVPDLDPGPSRGRLLDVTDPTALRALAHPVRLRLLALVREHRPITGARLAEMLGESTASVSYHLSVLARHGFIERDPRPGPTRRHKPWRTTYDALRITSVGGGRLPVETAEGAVLTHLLGEVRREQDEYLTASSLPDDWQDVGSFSLTRLALTADEQDRLAAEVQEVLDRYRDLEALPDNGRGRFSVSFVAVPTSVPGEDS